MHSCLKSCVIQEQNNESQTQLTTDWKLKELTEFMFWIWSTVMHV